MFTQQKVLGQDGQDLTQEEAKILPVGQDLVQDLRQDPGQDFDCHNLATLYKILGKFSCAQTFLLGLLISLCFGNSPSVV